MQPPLNGSGDVYNWYVRSVVNDIVHARLGRSAMGWADIDSAFEGPYTGGDDIILDVWTGFYGGDWQEDVGSLAQKNASIIVSGPFYVSATDRSSDYPHNSWEKMYAQDLSNFTGATPALLNRVLGGELTAGGAAAQCDSGNAFTVLTPEIFAVAESWWSPRSETSGRDGSNAQPRMELHRCRVGARGVPTNTIYRSGRRPRARARSRALVLSRALLRHKLTYRSFSPSLIQLLDARLSLRRRVPLLRVRLQPAAAVRDFAASPPAADGRISEKCRALSRAKPLLNRPRRRAVLRAVRPRPRPRPRLRPPQSPHPLPRPPPPPRPRLGRRRRLAPA